MGTTSFLLYRNTGRTYLARWKCVPEYGCPSSVSLIEHRDKDKGNFYMDNRPSGIIPQLQHINAYRLFTNVVSMLLCVFPLSILLFAWGDNNCHTNCPINLFWILCWNSLHFHNCYQCICGLLYNAFTIRRRLVGWYLNNDRKLKI
jgi:hypothetical protein